MKKVLAVSSGGGHWVQLRRLRQAFEGMEIVYASVYPEYAQDVPDVRFYTIRDSSRFSKLNSIILSLQLLRILIIERPRVVITTGAAPGLFAIAIAKMIFRSRTMWIDSIANCEKLSSSGAMARHFADVWLTQWPHLSKEDGPKHWGAVL